MSNSNSNGTSGGSSSSSYKKVLTPKTINPNVRNVEYAVRGEISNRANEYAQILSDGKDGGNKKDLPFDSVVTANIGNPQQQPNLAQKPITFWRQVSVKIRHGTRSRELMTNGDCNCCRSLL